MLAATVRNALHDRPVEMKVLLVYVPMHGCGRRAVRVCVRRMNRFCATATLFPRAGKSIDCSFVIVELW